MNLNAAEPNGIISIGESPKDAVESFDSQEEHHRRNTITDWIAKSLKVKKYARTVRPVLINSEIIDDGDVTGPNKLKPTHSTLFFSGAQTLYPSSNSKVMWMLQINHEYSFIPLLFLLASIGVLIPLLIGSNLHLDNTVLSQALTTRQFFNVMSATLALAGPLALDLFLEIFVSSNFIFEFSRFSAIMALAIPSIVFLNIENVRDPEATFVTLRYWQVLIWNSVVITTLQRNCPAVYDKYKAYAIAFTLIVDVFCDVIGMILDIHNLRLASQVFRHMYYLTTFSTLPFYALYFYKRYKDLIDTLSFSKLILDMHHEDYNMIATLSSSGMAILGTFLMPFLLTGNFIYSENYSSDFIVGFYILFAIFMICFDVIPGRVAKFTALRLLQTNLDNKRSFVSYISHEIRTPLNTCCLGLDLIEQKISMDTFDKEEIHCMIIEVQESSSIAVEILNDLLNYEKISTGILKLDQTNVYPIPFILRVIQPLTIQANEKRVKFAVLKDVLNENDTELRGYEIRVDESKMGQVLRNFASNALKFTPSGGNVDIRALKVERAGCSWLRFECQDSGHGIALENQGKVFNEMVQFNANAQQGGGGSGLGLWISKKIVELHGGIVGLISAGEGHGCLVFFEIPLIRAAAVDREFYSSVSVKRGMSLAPRSKDHSEVSNADKRKLNLLVVDDSAINRKMMGKAMGFLGHHVTEASDGDEAVVMVRKALEEGSAYDVVLMDNSMPKMNGTDAAVEMRKLGFTNYIIGVTGNGLKEQIDEYMQCGVDAVVVKPMDTKKFLSTMIELEAKKGRRGSSRR